MAPSLLDALPGEHWHGEHCTVPLDGAYFPAVQLEHCAVPLDDEYRPVVQAEHCAAPVDDSCPAVQFEQCHVDGAYWPALHASQLVKLPG